MATVKQVVYEDDAGGLLEPVGDGPARTGDAVPPREMYFVILSGAGNLVESFDGQDDSRALERMVREKPEAAEHFALLTYDEQREPVGEAITITASRATSR